MESALVLVLRQQSVQVHEPIPAAVFRDGQHRGCAGVDRLLCATGDLLEDAVEIGRYKVQRTVTIAGEGDVKVALQNLPVEALRLTPQTVFL